MCIIDFPLMQKRWLNYDVYDFDLLTFKKMAKGFGNSTRKNKLDSRDIFSKKKN